jgi:hypothetical protein
MSDGTAYFNDEKGNITDKVNTEYDYLINPIFP